MTIKKAESINKLIDEVHLMMYRNGYDKAKLNKAFFIFNLMQSTNTKDSLLAVVNQLLLMNEKVEYYEVCSFLETIKSKINGK